MNPFYGVWPLGMKESSICHTDFKIFVWDELTLNGVPYALVTPN
jgi:hypothetical protein